MVCTSVLTLFVINQKYLSQLCCVLSVYAGSETKVAGKASKTALNVDTMESDMDFMKEGHLSGLALSEDLGAILPEFGLTEGDCLDSFMDLSNFLMQVS